jgi:hypothetical protein
MYRAYFDTVEEAVEHAKQHGGWIAQCNDETVQWFCATRWTLKPIFSTIARESGCGNVGPWTTFANPITQSAQP